MTIKKFFLLSFLICSILILNSCKKEDKANWLSNWAFPIAHTTIGIENLIPDSLMSINSDGSVNLSYVTNLNTLNTQDLIKIPDTTITNRLSVPFGNFLVNPGITVFQKTELLNFHSSSHLTRMILKSGKLKYTIKNYTDGILDISYLVNEARKNNVSLTVNKTIPKLENSQPGIVSGEIDLSNYDLKLNATGTNSSNVIITNLTANLSSQSPATNINSTDSLIIAFTFSGLIPSYAKGDFAPQEFNATGSTNVSTFKNLSGGNFSFEKLNLSLVIENGIGADIKAKINFLEAKKKLSNTSIQLNHSLIGSTINMTRANEYPYETVKKYYSLTEGNSNILDFIELMPDQLNYSISGELNPLGNISSLNDFAYTDKLIMAHLDLKIPLKFSAEKMVLSDTSSFKWPIDEEQQKNINYLKLKILAENQIPLGTKLSITFLDENKLPLKELLINGEILAATQELNNPNSTAVKSQLSSTLSPSVYEEIKNTRYIIWKTEFNTYNLPQKNTWYSNYLLKINVLGSVEYRMHL